MKLNVQETASQRRANCYVALTHEASVDQLVPWTRKIEVGVPEEDVDTDVLGGQEIVDGVIVALEVCDPTVGKCQVWVSSGPRAVCHAAGVRAQCDVGGRCDLTSTRRQYTRLYARMEERGGKQGDE